MKNLIFNTKNRIPEGEIGNGALFRFTALPGMRKKHVPRYAWQCVRSPASGRLEALTKSCALTHKQSLFFSHNQLDSILRVALDYAAKTGLCSL